MQSEWVAAVLQLCSITILAGIVIFVARVTFRRLASLESRPPSSADWINQLEDRMIERIRCEDAQRALGVEPFALNWENGFVSTTDHSGRTEFLFGKPSVDDQVDVLLKFMTSLNQDFCLVFEGSKARVDVLKTLDRRGTQSGDRIIVQRVTCPCLADETRGEMNEASAHQLVSKIRAGWSRLKRFARTHTFGLPIRFERG